MLFPLPPALLVTQTRLLDGPLAAIFPRKLQAVARQKSIPALKSLFCTYKRKFYNTSLRCEISARTSGFTARHFQSTSFTDRTRPGGARCWRRAPGPPAELPLPTSPANRCEFRGSADGRSDGRLWWAAWGLGNRDAV